MEAATAQGWEAWRPWYDAICSDFGYDPAADRAAAWRLRALLPDSAGGAGGGGGADPFAPLAARLRGRRVVVVGCGPALEDVCRVDVREGPVVACDGAAEKLGEIGVVPDLLVTDLDGEPEALVAAAQGGAVPVVHAHGDNVPALEGLVPRMGPRVLATHQSAPEPGLAPMRNLGGFTDGDRAVRLLEAVGAAEARLLAFDFAAPPSRYSHRFDPATKPRKLAWAARIVDDVAARARLRVVSL